MKVCEVCEMGWYSKTTLKMGAEKRKSGDFSKGRKGKEITLRMVTLLYMDIWVYSTG